MAIARCLKHVPQNRGGRIYSHYVEPISHPNSGLICGKNDCEAPAYILLDDTHDISSFNKGNRIFGEPDREYAKFRSEENSVLKALP